MCGLLEVDKVELVPVLDSLINYLSSSYLCITLAISMELKAQSIVKLYLCHMGKGKKFNVNSTENSPLPLHWCVNGMETLYAFIHVKDRQKAYK